MGAPDPRDGQAVAAKAEEIDFAKAREFWSLKKLATPKLPTVKNSSVMASRYQIPHFGIIGWWKIPTPTVCSIQERNE